jgi:hypothetical protein
LAFPAGVRAIFSLSASATPAATSVTPAAATNTPAVNTTRRVYDRSRRSHNPRAYDLRVAVEIFYCPV